MVGLLNAPLRDTDLLPIARQQQYDPYLLDPTTDAPIAPMGLPVGEATAGLAFVREHIMELLGGKPAETFLDGLLYDTGVLLSLVFQYGTPTTALAKSVARREDHNPASPVGELIDVIVKEVETANQSNSQGATDTDV